MAGRSTAHLNGQANGHASASSSPSPPPLPLPGPNSYRRLSSPITTLQPHYSVVVVGSGYGASIAASRLSRLSPLPTSPWSVAVLEKGKEFTPGEYPETAVEGLKEFNLQSSEYGHVAGQPDSLYALYHSPSISVFHGVGLGGTSQVNANVALEADPRLWQQRNPDGSFTWPEPLRRDLDRLLHHDWPHARDMLRPAPFPDDYDRGVPAKIAVTKAMNRGPGDVEDIGRWYKPPIFVNFTDQHANHVGLYQPACNNCGNCCSGCNVGAKNTLIMNLLPDAVNHGASIFVDVEVVQVQRDAGTGRWVLHYQYRDAEWNPFGVKLGFVTADLVVIGAGVLGSTELLFRSASPASMRPAPNVDRNAPLTAPLPIPKLSTSSTTSLTPGPLTLSPRLGDHFSGNGDLLSFIMNSKAMVTNGTGWVHRDAGGPATAAGPCITTVIDARGVEEYEKGFVIEDGTAPGAIGDVYQKLLFVASHLLRTVLNDQEQADFNLLDLPKLRTDGLKVFDQPDLTRSLGLLTMAHDDSGGRLSYNERGLLECRWDNVGTQPFVQTCLDAHQRAAKAVDGQFVADPLWAKLLHHQLITVHPLGGCIMGDDGGKGVVNDRCQVWEGQTGRVYDSLLVMDGSVIPRSVGVNPVQTICSVSERAIRLLAEQRGWTIDYAIQPVNRPVPPPTCEMQFTERMAGFFSTAHKTPLVTREQRAALKASSGALLADPGCHAEFTLCMETQDLDRFLSSPQHQAEVTGSVTVSALAATPFSVHSAIFRLFVDSTTTPPMRLMQYQLILRHEDGRTPYFWSGTKYVVNDALGLDAVEQTCTLYVNVYEGVDATGPMVGAGVVTIALFDFMKQVSTIAINPPPRVTTNLSVRERMQREVSRVKYTARFLQFFCASLVDIYYCHALTFKTPAVQSMAASDAQAQQLTDSMRQSLQKRQLRIGGKLVYTFDTADQVELKLTRYWRVGARTPPPSLELKGPILMVSGMSSTSLMFGHHTNPTTLLEELLARGYDVWLLDWRASPLVPFSHSGTYNFDEVARYDLPPAVDLVLQLTGARTVQIFLHCMGNPVFFMSVLGGWLDPRKVRSAVCHQVAFDTLTSTFNNVKAELHVGSLLLALGVKDIEIVPDHSTWLTKLFDGMTDVTSKVVRGSAEWCDLPACHRLSFCYNSLFNHASLSPQTHATVSGIIGTGCVAAFNHVAAVVNAGYIVNAQGDDVYLRRREGKEKEREQLRLLSTFPIQLVTNSANQVWLPSAMDTSEEKLRQNNRRVERVRFETLGHLDSVLGDSAKVQASTLCFPAYYAFLDKYAAYDGTAPAAAAPQQVRQPIVPSQSTAAAPSAVVDGPTTSAPAAGTVLRPAVLTPVVPSLPSTAATSSPAPIVPLSTTLVTPAAISVPAAAAPAASPAVTAISIPASSSTSVAPAPAAAAASHIPAPVFIANLRKVGGLFSATRDVSVLISTQPGPGTAGTRHLLTYNRTSRDEHRQLGLDGMRYRRDTSRVVLMNAQDSVRLTLQSTDADSLRQLEEALVASRVTRVQ